MEQLVYLRPVTEEDLPTLFEQQLVPEAVWMAAFPSKEREAFFAHWAKILRDDTVVIRAIVYDGRVAGNVMTFVREGLRLIGYWLGKEFWGRGFASAALPQFLGLLPMRPLHAYVVKHNPASLRVLQKSGFTICNEKKFEFEGEQLEEFLLVLGANQHDEPFRSTEALA
jgi:RimJ/RimL family protein N-acetyltransferase